MEFEFFLLVERQNWVQLWGFANPHPQDCFIIQSRIFMQIKQTAELYFIIKYNSASPLQLNIVGWFQVPIEHYWMIDIIGWFASRMHYCTNLVIWWSVLAHALALTTPGLLVQGPLGLLFSSVEQTMTVCLRKPLSPTWWFVNFSTVKIKYAQHCPKFCFDLTNDLMMYRLA